MLRLFATGVLVMTAAIPASAQTLTTSIVATGLTKPMEVASPPGDAARLFVLEQRGIVKLIKNGVLQATAFLNIDSTVPEQTYSGLFGIAFHPDYASNGKFYLHHTTGTTSAIIVWIVEYTRNATNQDIADTASRRVIMRIASPSTQGYHLGGTLIFGGDGYLYIPLGDGGYTGDPQGGTRSQSMTSLWGKILRVDVNGDDFPADASANYAIPPTNPYVGGMSTVDDPIYAKGLRNPFRCSRDPLTGTLWIGDVGGTVREEVDVFDPTTEAGANFAWNCVEGTLCTSNANCSCPSASLKAPVYEYTHSVGLSITGGTVYRGCAIPALEGQYLFADYQNSKAWRMNLSTGSPVVTDITAQLAPVSGPVCIGADASGELFIVNHTAGTVRRITSNPAPPDSDADGIPDSCEVRPGDVNGDGVVSAADLSLILAGWGASGPTDLNGDGTTDSLDIGIVLADWG
ncbi:MAG: hypothetical protein EXS03_03235 [Phycisphaerales bacterium]|nr:hypothetical protein [Phycisphaerales bacterium]